GSEFIIIIDEWDALFREAKENKQIQQEYVKLLRGLFKGGTATDESIAAAYMTGILPIKKYGTESALTDFEEYTMANPDELAEYVGFTESEVRNLCESQNMDFEEMKCWYDGYSYEGIGSVYSPNSVMSALRRRSFRSYWSSSETYESLKNYISMDFDGLKTAILSMLGGTPVKVKISTFQNDLTSFKNKDDILTLLIHLGYLAYDARTELARIPNLEVSDAFGDAVSEGDWKYIGRAIRDSEDLLEATLRCDADAVAEALEQIHSLNASVLEYNNEASLSSAIMIAYYTAKRYYKVVREFPEGKGFADIVFMPRRNTDKPALLIELKYNRSADSAIKQIHDRCYDGDLKEFFGNLLLVGINYDRNAKGNTMKKHTCIIEKI
ncbi:MAG: ATP-binding protein, partial [Lachnospiraceae bacterium]|nr:ATP-binding protein [Lachnospiraceae bacterium]